MSTKEGIEIYRQAVRNFKATGGGVVHELMHKMMSKEK
jgi:hypothetical protein